MMSGGTFIETPRFVYKCEYGWAGITLRESLLSNDSLVAGGRYCSYSRDTG